MRRYVITCDFQHVSQNYGEIAKLIKSLDPGCHQPHRGAWVVQTPLSAIDLRERLLPHFDFSDRLFICEAGGDAANFNAVQPASSRNVIQFEGRRKSNMLSSVFTPVSRHSRMLTAATARS